MPFDTNDSGLYLIPVRPEILGTLGPKGELAVWPVEDITGRNIQRTGLQRMMTTRVVAPGQFIAIPPEWDSKFELVWPAAPAQPVGQG